MVTSEIRFLLTDHYLGTLQQQLYDAIEHRTSILRQAIEYHHAFLTLCRNYAIVPKNDRRMVEHFLDNKELLTTDLMAGSEHRARKIERYKMDKALQESIATLQKGEMLQEDLVRRVAILSIHSAISKSLQEVEAIEKEILVLAHRPANEVEAKDLQDPLQRPTTVADDWRLDTHKPFLGRNGAVCARCNLFSMADTLGIGAVRHHQ